MAEISEKEVAEFQAAVQNLVGIRVDLLRIPREVLKGFEPSQIGTIVGTLMDACIPQLHLLLEGSGLEQVGLEKHQGEVGDREGYPDYVHKSGKRVELKLLYVDPVDVEMKKPPTPREPSARLTQKVTVKNVDPARDVLLVLAYQLQPEKEKKGVFVPTIIDLAVFSMIECIRARDKRLADAGGIWFGDYETPAVLSKIGRSKLKNKEAINKNAYGRKESEGKDFNEDTNFGKLKRIPYKPFQDLLKKYRAINGEESDEEDGEAD
jgi:hypothetical protein